MFRCALICHVGPTWNHSRQG